MAKGEAFQPNGTWAELTVTKDRQEIGRGVNKFGVSEPVYGEVRSEATLEIYDQIGFWGVSGQDVADWLRGLDVKQLTVRINSTGGNVFDGIAIFNAIKDFPAPTTVIVDGIAASAASVIAMAGDEIIMNIGSQMMIHDAWTMTEGNARELRKYADDLDKMSDSIADVYADRAGGTREEWRAVMAEEQWYTADEAVTAGLANRVNRSDASVPAENRLKIFNYAGRADAPAPFMPETAHMNSPAELGEEKDNQLIEEDMMSDAFKAGLRERLGMTAPVAEITDDMFLAAVDEALAETAQGEGTNEESAPVVPDGTVVIEEDVLEELKKKAAKADELEEQEAAREREELVAAAIKDGRIAPARREHWVAALKADAGAAQTLNSLAPGLIPVAPMGVDEDEETDTVSEEDRVYAKMFGDRAEKNEEAL